MKKAILLVDDEPLIREIIQSKLGESEYLFHEAENGQEALSVLEKHPEILLVVSDIKMPKMDGIQFIKEARAKKFEQPFVFFTAFASREIINEASQYGVCGFLEKVHMEGLEDAILLGLHEDLEAEDSLQKAIDRLS